MQGELEGRPFLITWPIRWGTRAVYAASDADEVTVIPAHRKKAKLAAEALLRHWGLPTGGVLVIYSLLPVGKGMASSSADIVAALRAVAHAYHRPLTPLLAARLAASIEPTDGIMYPGVVAINPITGQLLEKLGPVPKALVIGIIGHGRVNTEEQHLRRKPYHPDHQERLAKALGRARQGLRQRDWREIGEASRISAEVEAERRPDDRILKRVLGIAADEGWTPIIAHTGTVRGFLFSEAAESIALKRAESKLRALDEGPVYRFVTASGYFSTGGVIVPHANWPAPSHS